MVVARLPPTLERNFFTTAMPTRYALFEYKPTGRPLVVRAGWSWFAFVFGPLWAACNDIWTAALGMSLLGGALAYSVFRSHGSASALFAVWILISWWMGDDGQRWVIRRFAARFDEGELRYLGGAIARSKMDAEDQARKSIEIRERFYAAARVAPPEHVAQALEMLNDDTAL